MCVLRMGTLLELTLLSPGATLFLALESCCFHLFWDAVGEGKYLVNKSLLGHIAYADHRICIQAK